MDFLVKTQGRTIRRFTDAPMKDKWRLTQYIHTQVGNHGSGNTLENSWNELDLMGQEEAKLNTLDIGHKALKIKQETLRCRPKTHGLDIAMG